MVTVVVASGGTPYVAPGWGCGCGVQGLSPVGRQAAPSQYQAASADTGVQPAPVGGGGGRGWVEVCLTGTNVRDLASNRKPQSTMQVGMLSGS